MSQIAASLSVLPQARGARVLLRQIRRMRIESGPQVGLGHAGRQMAADAQGGVAARPGGDAAGILEIRPLDGTRPHPDGTAPQLLDECQHDPGMVVVGSDVVDARADEHAQADACGGDRARYCEGRPAYTFHGLRTTIVPTMRGWIEHA